ncbi:DNA methylase [Mycobacterium phage Thibault]|uniref:DNA methylase n=1 Tax=Mycobacterium phage Thibault TaxID=1052673 RepID=G1FGG7_9CAUD|nr:DNA methyltransferase [Mycobacterium phage Thibault]AEJ94025.1 DNA methylase [Mycobacterium phage Thibault]
MMTLTHVDLFAGIGGFSLALQRAGAKTVAAVEIDKHCQKVLGRTFSGSQDLPGCMRHYFGDADRCGLRPLSGGYNGWLALSGQFGGGEARGPGGRAVRPLE